MMLESKKDKKNLNFEINLVSFIDLLSVCICFLLITNAWTLLGAVELKQGTGTQALTSEKTPILVLSLNGTQLEFKLKNATQNLATVMSATGGDFNQQASANIKRFQLQQQDLKSAIVLSSPGVPYKQIVAVLEVLKGQGMTQVGLSSL